MTEFAKPKFCTNGKNVALPLRILGMDELGVVVVYLRCLY